MQIYAFDAKNRLVPASQALKKQDYFCLECQSTLRARGGLHRQMHFYHTSNQTSCRQNGKSLIHLQVQLHLQKILPQGETTMEYRFHEINRIADLVWLPQKMIFEIQCSPISADEVKERNRDYTSLGYQVVWILHDQMYNQMKITAAEQFLRFSPHYFTNIDQNGEGIIYDQYDFIEKGLRKKVLSPLSIDLNKPSKINSKKRSSTPLNHRLGTWSIHFEGDLVSLGPDHSYIKQILKIEADALKASKRTLREIWTKFVTRPYKLFLQHLLERACK